MYCSSCGSVNSDDGRFCIQCGLSLQSGRAPQRQRQPLISLSRRILKWVGIVFGCLLGLFVLLIILVAVFSDNGGNQSPGTARQIPSAPSLTTTATPTRHPTPAPRPTPTRIVVTANALEREHEANEVSWESQYVDKYAFITGSISSIRDAGSEFDVDLNTDNSWVNIVCKVGQSNRSSVLELATGETVTVYGLVTNDGIIDIVVKNCTVRSPQSIQAKDREQSSIATPGTTSGQGIVPTPTTLHPTATPDHFDQYQGAAKNVAAITVYIGTPTGSGSGFLHRIHDSGDFVILTNAHVVQDYSSVEVCWALIQKCVYEQVMNQGSEVFDVTVIEFAQFLEHGLASETFQWFTSWYEKNIAKFEGGSSQWAKGDIVYASGYPGGHKVQGKDIISDPVVTEGIIATDRLASYRKVYFIEHGANIEPGSSGGPLIGNASNVIGINTGTNLLTEQLELAIPMASVVQWLETGEEPSLTRTPRLLPDSTPEASPAPASDPTPVPTPTATPRPTQAPIVGTRENPIPLGSSVSYPEWNVSVAGFTSNGNELIASSSTYYAPPDSEHVYVLVEVRGTYTGTGVGGMYRDLNYYMVGQSNRIHEIKTGLGYYDGLYRHPRVFQGGTVAGSLAFMVPSNEVSSLLLIVADGSLHSRDTTFGYFSLDASRVSSSLKQ